jgi:hypothetical protein
MGVKAFTKIGKERSMFRNFLVISVFVVSAGLMFAADGDRHTFELTWQEHGTSGSFLVELDRGEPFEKEPDFGQREILRGTMQYFGPSENITIVPFAWDKSDTRLYIDLNKDGDLTNDPNGILQSDNRTSGQYQRQEFPEFDLHFETEKGLFRYRLGASLLDYSYLKQADFRIRSGYGGTINLHGVEWHFGVNDALAGQVQEGSNLTVQPTTQPGTGEKPEGYSTNFISSLPAPKSLFIDGRCYDLDFEFKKSENDYPALWCTLTEKEVPLGELLIEGQWLNELVLKQDDMYVLPPLTEQAVTVPAGDYHCEAVRIAYADQRRASPMRPRDITVTVPKNDQGLLKVGGPLQNAVRVERVGKTLKFHYELKGIGGEVYNAQEITGYDNDKKPAVAIFKGDMKLGGGQFEYG